VTNATAQAHLRNCASEATNEVEAFLVAGHILIVLQVPACSQRAALDLSGGRESMAWHRQSHWHTHSPV